MCPNVQLPARPRDHVTGKLVINSYSTSKSLLRERRATQTSSIAAANYRCRRRRSDAAARHLQNSRPRLSVRGRPSGDQRAQDGARAAAQKELRGQWTQLHGQWDATAPSNAVAVFSLGAHTQSPARPLELLLSQFCFLAMVAANVCASKPLPLELYMWRSLLSAPRQLHSLLPADCAPLSQPLGRILGA